jgi:hypothetical protein
MNSGLQSPDMKRYINFSTLPVKIVLLILALTTLIALQINPTENPTTRNTTVDTTHAEALPIGLVPWAMSMLETQALLRLKHAPTHLHYQRPDQIITKLVEATPLTKKKDTLGIDLAKFDSQH